MRGDGRIYQRGSRYWVEYWWRGTRHRESGGRTEGEARKMLKARMREIHGDRFVGPQQERLMMEQLLDDLLLHLQNKGIKSLPDYVSHLKPVRGFFALRRAVDVTTTEIERFIQQRLADGRARATVNRETGALAQAFNLALKQGRISRVPHVPMLKLDNARQGFFERGEFEALASMLPAHLQDVATFAYLTGWRKGEIVPLRWDAVDRTAREMRLRTSKSGRGRVIRYSGILAELIERRWRARQFETSDGQCVISEFVFHDKGAPAGDFKKAWATACRKAGLPGRLFHDLRRTAVRNMIRAGVPETVAMSISGHRTRSMFDRYNITSTADLEDAFRKTQDYLATVPRERNLTEFNASETEAR